VKPLRVLAGSIGFFSALPAGNGKNFNEFLNHLEIIPLTGAIIGAILGVISYFLSFFNNLLILFPIAYLMIEGLNHMDGLSDFADGIYATGDRENKIRAMQDVNTGVGGTSAVAIYLIILTYSIFTMDSPITRVLAVILSQTYSKFGILLLLKAGNPIHPGLAEMFAKNVNSGKIIKGFLIAIVISMIWLPVSIYGLFLSIIITILVLNLSKKHFGGISGDTAGALNCIIFASGLLFFGVIS